MQKLFEIRKVTCADYVGLKELWKACFDDSPQAVDNFFLKTVTPDNVIAAFDGERAVGAVYLIESTVTADGKEYGAYYIYGVCTHPLYRKKGIMTECFSELEKIALRKNIDYVFLVPAEESLFKMYEKLGFKTGFGYCEETVYSPEKNKGQFDFVKLSYGQYVKFRRELSKSAPVATLGESGFNSFLCPVGDDIVCVSDGNGYAVFEKENGKITVHEWAGEKAAVLSAVFSVSGAESLVLRKPTKVGGIPFGMYRAFGKAPELISAFFGIPYGG